MPEPVSDSTLQSWEVAEIENVNASGRPIVLFVHGLWLLSSSWIRWRTLFEEAGYATIAPGWPDDPVDVQAAREHPEVFANKMVQQVTDHYAEAIAGLSTRPAVIGHSFGGLIAQKLAGTGLSAATVSVDSAPFKGVIPLPASSLKSASPVLSAPGNLRRAVSLTYDQFKFGWANNLSDEDAYALYETFHVPAAGRPLFEAASANLNLFSSETSVDTRADGRGPLLVIGGANDNTVPLAITHAIFKLQHRNTGVTELAEVPDRGHSLTIDAGWREVATVALEFIRRFL